MSLLLSAELAAACNALGHYDAKSDVYFNEDNLVETVKDIIRYLRRDNEAHDTRRYFGSAKIVQISLLPLLNLYWKQTDLFDVLLRLLGNLTSPVLLLYNEEVPKDKNARNQFMEILGHLQSYKESFANDKFWAVLCTKLSELLHIDCQDRGEENGLIIERILILVRNVLHIPADTDDQKRADNDVSAHDKVLWCIRQSGLVDIINYMVSSDQEESYSMYLLEILSLMLREHRPIDLAQASGERTKTEKYEDDTEFKRTRSRELTQRRERLKNYTSARHSRFGGTYCLRNMKSVHDTQDLIYHKKLNTADSIDFDVDKTSAKIHKNRKPVQETISDRRSTFSIRLLLKDFCVEFLNSGYNKLMHVVRGKLVRGHGMENDESYYLWALRFFMEFNRHHKFNVKLVSETIGNEIFYYILQRTEHYFEMISSDKKKLHLWAKRLHLAVKAYKELLLNINQMDKSKDSTIRQHSKVIKSNIFYVVEYREIVLHLLAVYDEKKMSNIYLLDLIETQHIFLKMLEAYCGKDNSIVVQKIQKVKKKRKQQTASAPTVSADEALEIKWDEIGPQLSTVLEGGENIPVMVPFDAASDVPINDQRKDAMLKVQDYLRDNEIENAIGLLRAARDVWPDNDSFGSSSMTPEEEFLAIREIFFCKLRDKEKISAQPSAIEEEEDEEEDEDDDEEIAVEREVDFKFQEFVNRFVQSKIVQACALALRQFDTNPIMINHCILKLLHRIAWDCKMPAMLFQASIFRTFQRILSEKNRPEYKELVKFAIYIIRQFVKVAEKNKKVFMELLFWKSSKDAYDVEEGYGSYENKSKAMKSVWTEEQENELRVLVMEFKEKEITEDAVDWISNNLVDNTKTRRQIIRKLKELMLFDYKGKKSTTSHPRNWTEDEINQLKDLYDQFKDAMDPLDCIIARLSVKRPKARVKQKLLELGLADNKALRKKRSSKSRGHQEEDNFSPPLHIPDDDENSSDDSSNDDENDTHNHNIINKIKPRPGNKNTNRKTKKSSNNKVVNSQKLQLPAVKKIILEIIENDLLDSLKWISECLTEAAEDQEQDDHLDESESIPLVPINSKDVQAINNSIFQRFLLGIGLQKPANYQEHFWRIPGNEPAAELNKLANFINEIVEKGVDAYPEYNEQIPVERDTLEESSDEDVFDRIRKFVSKPKTSEQEPFIIENEDRNKQLEYNDEEIIEFNLENGVISSKKSTNIPKKKSKIITMIDSDESDNESVNTQMENNKEEVVEFILENSVMSQSCTRKSKRIAIESDESDNESGKITEELGHKEQDKDELNVSKKKTQRILNYGDESDSDIQEIEIENVNISQFKQKSKRILDDEQIYSKDDNKTSSKKSVLENEEIAPKRTRESDSENRETNHSVKRKRLVINDSDED